MSGAKIAKVVFEEEATAGEGERSKMKPPVELEVRKQASDYIQPSTEVNFQKLTQILMRKSSPSANSMALFVSASQTFFILFIQPST